MEQIERDPDRVRIARALDAVALQRTEVVGVAQFRAKLLEDLPVAPLAVGPRRLQEMTPQIGDHRVVVEQRVVDVEQKDDVAHAASGGQGAFAYPDRNGVTMPLAGSNL